MELFPKKLINETRKEKIEKIGSEEMEIHHWQSEILSITDIFSNTEFKENIENGKYNVIIVDDASGRIPGLIFKQIIDYFYTKNRFKKPHVLFLPGQGRHPEISDELGKYVAEKINTAQINDPQCLFVTNTISNGRTLKVLGSALSAQSISSDVATLSFEGPFRKEWEVQNLIGGKIYAPDKNNPGAFGSATQFKYHSGGVIKNKEKPEFVSKKVQGFQDDINIMRDNIKAISEEIINFLEKAEETNLDKINRFGFESGYLLESRNTLALNILATLELNDKTNIESKKYLKNKCREAINLSWDLHRDQNPRPDGFPYLIHVFSVTNRLMTEYGIKDLELIIAALLHDSVEDQSQKLANMATDYPRFGEIASKEIVERDKALYYISKKFGSRVANIVEKLSNPEPEIEGLSSQEKNNIYKEHVKEAIEDSDVLPIKLSDFSDNALNLKAVGDPIRRLKLSKKYLPVMQVFIQRLDSAQDILSQEKINEMKSKLQNAILETEEFIKSQNK
jgi:hypothetical protein